MQEEHIDQCEFIPGGLSGVITIGVSSRMDADEPEPLLTSLAAHLEEHQLTDIEVRASGGFGFFSAERLVKVSKHGLPSIIYGGVTPDLMADIVRHHLADGAPVSEAALCQMPIREDSVDGIPHFKDIAFFGLQQPVVSWRCGHINPERIEDAFRTGSYGTLETILKQGPKDILSMIETAQMHGHGGPGSSIVDRWTAVAEQDEETVLICNALEVEAGSFKDQWLMESDPHRIIEGMIIAARAIGARIGYIVLNPLYTLAKHRLEIAISQARRHRRLGQGIQGSSVDFDIIIRSGPPGYITGEETALVSFLSGEAGPHVMPPSGIDRLNDQPALVANVETFAQLAVLPFGSDEEGPPPTRLFTLEGTTNTGVVEVEVGTTLRELICDMGATSEEYIKAVAIGGHLGGVIPADLLDTPLAEASYRWLNIWPGTGLLSVIDQSVSMSEWLGQQLQFGAQESCGACTPCREGMEQAHRLMQRLRNGDGQGQDLILLDQLASYISNSSMCGYGQAVPNGISTAIRYFGNELRDQLTGGH
jgi:NADH-quinone oxidoreductase subunit F